jgi:hypothetical protein
MSFLTGIDHWLSRVPLGKESCARTGRMGKAAPGGSPDPVAATRDPEVIQAWSLARF